MLSRKNYINIKTTYPISLTFFSSFLSSDFRVFIFCVFCISSNKRSSHRKCSVKKGALRNFAKFTWKHPCQSLFLIMLQAYTFFIEHLRTTASVTNGISSGICLPFKSRHVELFCKIVIQLFSTGIFLGFLSRGSPCNFTEQLVFLHRFECLLPIT